MLWSCPPRRARSGRRFRPRCTSKPMPAYRLDRAVALHQVADADRACRRATAGPSGAGGAKVTTGVSSVKPARRPRVALNQNLADRRACPAWRTRCALLSRSFTPTTCFTRSSRKYVFSGVNVACGSIRSTYASSALSGRNPDKRGRLADLHLADLPLGDEAPKVNPVEIQQGHNRRAGLHHLARLSRPRHDRAIEGRLDRQVVAGRLRFSQLESRLVR